MKSRDERKADFERREVERKAKYRERMDSLKAKSAAQKDARLAAKAEAPSQSPHRGPTLAGILIPPLGAYQVVRSTVDQFKEMNAMTPDERAEYMRRNPGFGSGGPM